MIAIATNLIVRPSTVTTTTNSRINSVTKDSHVPFSFSHRSLIPMQQDLDSKFISNDKPPNFTAENNMSSYYNENFNFVQQSTNWSERILQDIIGLLHILSPSGKVLYCSESCLELTGYSPHELIGKSLTDFIHVDDLDIFSRNLQLAFTSLSRIKVHYRIRRKDKTYLLLESIGHPKQDVPDQPPQSFFAIAQPYLSRSNGLLDSFLELKMENEWLKKRLNDLLPYQQQQQQQHQQQIEQQQQQQQQIEQQQIEQQQQHKQQQQQQQKQKQQKKQQHQQHHQQRQHIQQQHQQHQHQHQHQQQQQYQQQQLQQHHQPIQLQYYPQPFFTNDLLLGTNEPYFINTSPQTSSRRPSSCSSTMFQTNNPISMADDSINNHCNTETKYSPSIGSVEFNEMLIRYNQEEDPTSGGMATTSSYLSSNNSATTSVTDILRKDKWKRRKKHRGMDDYVCADCGTTASPEWRKGPHGPKTLCNACGLRWAKKNKKI